MAQNDVEIRVRATDDTRAGFAKAKATAKTEGRKAGAEFGDGMTDEASKGVKRGQGKLATAGKALGAAVGVGAGAALASGLSNAIGASDAQAKLKAQLGSGGFAAEAGQIAGNLYGQAYGDSLGQVGEAVRSVVQSGAVMEGATSDQIQRVTGLAMAMAQAFDQDVSGSINAVAQMIRTGLAPDAEAAMDILTRGFQQGNDKAGDLLDTFNEYGTQFRKLGLDGAQAMGLISQGMRAGARDADIVADAIKEFSIRAIDGSSTTENAFRSIGLSADDMRAKIAKGGPEAAQALGLTLDKLREIKDPAERSAAAVALFGTQAEDLGEALFALDLSSAASEMGNVAGAADKVNAALGESAKAKVDSLTRSFDQWTASLISTKGPIGDVGAGVAAFGPMALETLGPLASLAAALRMGGIAAAIKSGPSAAVGGIGLAADGSKGKLGALRGGLKVLGGLAIGAALIEGFQQLNIAIAGGKDQMGQFQTRLDEALQVAQQFAMLDWGGVFDAFANIDPGGRAFASGESYAGAFIQGLKRASAGVYLDPIQITADTTPASENVQGFLSQVNAFVPSININGNSLPAQQALESVLAQVESGAATVDINGETLPAREALDYVIGLINAGAGSVDVNGNSVPAGNALRDILRRIEESYATADIRADARSAEGTLNSLYARWNGRTINVNIGGSAGRLAHGGVGSGLNWVGEHGPELVRGMASGGPTGKGLRLVGEAGPELVDMPAGSTVIPNGATNRMLGQAASDGGGGSSGVRVNFGGNIDGAFATAFMRLVREGKIQLSAA